MGRATWVVIALSVLAASVRAGPTRSATFVFEGPAPIDGIENKRAAGAIESLVFDPKHPDTVWIGSVNGGVWKTTDFHADDDREPHWTPQTDAMPGLSIAALALDPTDASGKTLAAALGEVSSHGGAHGPLAGVLLTSDGGATWTSAGATELAGQDLAGIAALDGSLTVASRSTPGGVFRRPARATTFAQVADLPALPATSLVGDPQHPGALWVALVGLGGGVFHSRDGGKTWTQMSDGKLDALIEQAHEVTLSEQSYAGGERMIYAVIINAKPPANSPDGDIPAIFRIEESDGKDIYTEFSTSALPPFETADQAKVAVAADPLHDDTFYVGGDEGQLYRCVHERGQHPLKKNCHAVSDKVSLDHDGEAESKAEATGHGTFPHSDTRELVFVGDHALVSTDDGGVYTRTEPRLAKGDWRPKDGDLGITEAYSCAYDHHGHVFVCGTQDNGAIEQPGRGKREWTQLLIHDGGVAAVSDAPFPCPSHHDRTCSRRYFSQQRLGSFSFQDCDDSNRCTKVAAAPLEVHGKPLPCGKNDTGCVDDGLSTLTPVAADRFDAMRLVIATGKLWESTDGGATATAVDGFSGTATGALVLGGEKDGKDNADVLYVASEDGLFARTAPGRVKVTTWDAAAVHARGTPTGLDVDRDDFTAVWMITSKHQVWHGTDVTGPHEAWTEVTGDLAPGDASAHGLNAIAHVGGTSSYVAVGADDGVYVMATAAAGTWAKLRGKLPNVVIDGLSWSKADDVLAIATLGRSTWEIEAASALFDR